MAKGCLENEGAGWIPIADKFPSGDFSTPQHPSCRCLLETRFIEKSDIVIHNRGIDKNFEGDMNAPRCKVCLKRYNLRGLRGTVWAYCDRM